MLNAFQASSPGLWVSDNPMGCRDAVGDWRCQGNNQAITELICWCLDRDTEEETRMLGLVIDLCAVSIPSS